MKALTVRQPWASLITHGVKTIETRSWRTHYRGPIAIHAGKHRPECMEPVGDWFAYQEWYEKGWALQHFASGEPGAPLDIELPLGAIVATATLVGCVPMVAELPPQEQWRDPWQVMVVEPWPTLFTWPGFGSAQGDGSIADQAHYGVFKPGRWAWLLDDIEPCDPIPAKGRQGLWEWTP